MRTIAVVAPGAMGSAVAARLTEHGARVLTSLRGRSAATQARAEASGMIHAEDHELARADLFLSIVPPSDASALAERFAPVLAGAERRAVFVECNAVNVDTKRAIAAVVAATGATFVDGAIIGLPPKPGARGPRVYLAGQDLAGQDLAGEDVAVASTLREFGLDARVCQGGVGAAAGLKMAYAGLNKGLTALAATVVLAATRAGALEAFRAELAENEPALLARFERGLPDMVPKARRWAPEMREIAAFLGEDDAGRLIFQGAERFYARIASEEGAGAIADLLGFAEGPRRQA